jgi:chemotaxis protein methyltransferase CheR
LRATGGGSLRDYVAFVQTPGGREVLVEMVDALTTNKTSFFREDRHFDFLQELLDARDASAGMTVWSAGCSTGEEPYTLAMLLAEHRRERGGPPSRILAWPGS